MDQKKTDQIKNKKVYNYDKIKFYIYPYHIRRLF